ncbi:histidine phosphatase family protein [Clostridium sp. PL3]|uniref:Histidine phosphatase family protein n=1 Tax=Clostridium thailandense TaxID=2794346 RepID=A0A949TXM4_9CLOT|nr:histidine phosphatase family protein [Clostridium thailandense]MBV7273445.1 histidine phosphatase family protein [Clostridium thailandense]
MKIYITRHGETIWNTEGRLQGWNNTDLTEIGIDNARKLGESLKHINFDCVYCSPLGRAVETAKHIIGNKNTKIITEEALKELGFGCWEGIKVTDLEELYPDEIYNFFNKPHLYKPVDGENFEQLFSRVKEVLESIFIKSEYENILIVTHRVALLAIYAIVKKTPLEELWKQADITETCLSIIEVKGNEIKFILEANTSHLK